MEIVCVCVCVCVCVSVTLHSASHSRGRWSTSRQLGCMVGTFPLIRSGVVSYNSFCSLPLLWLVWSRLLPSVNLALHPSLSLSLFIYLFDSHVTCPVHAPQPVPCTPAPSCRCFPETTRPRVTQVLLRNLYFRASSFLLLFPWIRAGACCEIKKRKKRKEKRSSLLVTPPLLNKVPSAV